MKQEDKQLLLQDLLARLPYGVIFYVNGHDEIADEINPFEGTVNCGFQVFDIEECKPYLRPMSSMTEEEKRELSAKYNWSIMGNDISIRYHSEGYWDDDTECPTNEYLELFDWLNQHHFDYRGLIEKGLAIEVNKSNNPYKH